MGVEIFFLEPAKKAVKAAIAEAEKKTSAEIVVTVKRGCGDYRRADLEVGSLFALALLCVFLYHPEPFDFTYLPIELAAAFLLGGILSAYVPPIRRFFIPKKVLAANASRAAKAAFLDLGVHRTKGRTGVLIFVAAFERSVEVVADIGIHPKKLGASWDEVVRKLDRAFRLDGSIERFTDAIRELGPALGVEHPRAHDDENELPDHVDEHEDSDDEESEDESESEGARA
ncbi:MAG: hypothetical protein HOV80_14290 [Polyangiaceae bacterium]|nr:hypothetical protein [Polyangiaceae bacterium]